MSVANNFTTQPCHLQARGQATGTCACREAQYRYASLLPILWEWFSASLILAYRKALCIYPRDRDPTEPGSHKFHLNLEPGKKSYHLLNGKDGERDKVLFSRVPNLFRLGSSYQSLACMNDKYS